MNDQAEIVLCLYCKEVKFPYYQGFKESNDAGFTCSEDCHLRYHREQDGLMEHATEE